MRYDSAYNMQAARSRSRRSSTCVWWRCQTDRTWAKVRAKSERRCAKAITTSCSVSGSLGRLSDLNIVLELLPSWLLRLGACITAGDPWNTNTYISVAMHPRRAPASSEFAICLRVAREALCMHAAANDSHPSHVPGVACLFTRCIVQTATIPR